MKDASVLTAALVKATCSTTKRWIECGHCGKRHQLNADLRPKREAPKPIPGNFSGPIIMRRRLDEQGRYRVRHENLGLFT